MTSLEIKSLRGVWRWSRWATRSRTAQAALGGLRRLLAFTDTSRSLSGVRLENPTPN